MTDLSRDEVRRIAKEAAKETVEELFLRIGGDVSDPDAVIEMQKDFQHVRSWRRAKETVQQHSLKTAISVIVTGIMGWLLLTFGIGGGR